MTNNENERVPEPAHPDEANLADKVMHRDDEHEQPAAHSDADGVREHRGTVQDPDQTRDRDQTQEHDLSGDRSQIRDRDQTQDRDLSGDRDQTQDRDLSGDLDRSGDDDQTRVLADADRRDAVTEDELTAEQGASRDTSSSDGTHSSGDSQPVGDTHSSRDTPSSSGDRTESQASQTRPLFRDEPAGEREHEHATDIRSHEAGSHDTGSRDAGSPDTGPSTLRSEDTRSNDRRTSDADATTVRDSATSPGSSAAVPAAAAAGAGAAATRRTEETRVQPTPDPAAERAQQRAERERALGKVPVSNDPEPRPVTRPPRTTDKVHGAFALFLLRLVVAAIMGVHGVQKLMDLEGTRQFFETTALRDLGTQIPYYAALATAVGEVAIAVALVLGLLTRLAGLGTALIAAGALVLVKWLSNPIHLRGESGFSGELELLLAAVGILFLLLGAGAWSVDGAMRRNRARKRQAT